jgi:hypothetical protein
MSFETCACICNKSISWSVTHANTQKRIWERRVLTAQTFTLSFLTEKFKTKQLLAIFRGLPTKNLWTLLGGGSVKSDTILLFSGSFWIGNNIRIRIRAWFRNVQFAVQLSPLRLYKLGEGGTDATFWDQLCKSGGTMMFRTKSLSRGITS